MNTSTLDTADAICAAYRDEVAYHEERVAALQELSDASDGADELRSFTHHEGFWWEERHPHMWQCIELRQDSDGASHGVLVGLLLTRGERYATCACCGQQFDLDDIDSDNEQAWRFDGDSPVGPFCCSRECHEGLEVDFGTRCSYCGDAAPTMLDRNGNPSCGTLCGPRG